MIMQAQAAKRYSPEDYWELELASEERHEYWAGELIAMTGGTPNHNQIALNLAGALNFALRRQPYRVFVTDQRLWIPEQAAYAYPDVMVIAEPIAYAEGRRDTLTNPVIIAEVLSSSTRNHDKDTKFAAYRSIPSFREYLLIDQYGLAVEHYVKTSDRQWLFSEYKGADDSVILSSIPFQIGLADLYDKVDFAENR